MIIKTTLGMLLFSGILAFASTDPAGEDPGRYPQDEKKPKGPEYVGVGQCKTCHIKEFRSWKKTTMAETFNILKPGERAEAKTKHGLDPQKDYTKDESCLPCHVVGYGLPGGYPKLPTGDKKWTEKQIKLAAEMEGVQCESCHGPGSKVLPVFKEIKKDKRKYKTSELLPLGLVLPDEKNCLSCHNKTSPTFPKEGFDVKKLLKNEKQIHAHVKLKYREDE
mgnify:CR=1 FL=1